MKPDSAGSRHSVLTGGGTYTAVSGNVDTDLPSYLPSVSYEVQASYNGMTATSAPVSPLQPGSVGSDMPIVNWITVGDGAGNNNPVTQTDTTPGTMTYTQSADGSGSIYLFAGLTSNTPTAISNTLYEVFDVSNLSTPVASGNLSPDGQQIYLPPPVDPNGPGFLLETGVVYGGQFYPQQLAQVAPPGAPPLPPLPPPPAPTAPDRMYIDTQSITLCSIGNGNAATPIMIQLTTGPQGAPVAPPPRTLTVTVAPDDGNVTVPATLTTDANGMASLVIAPTPGCAGGLGGEPYVVTVTDAAGGGASGTIAVYFVPPVLTINATSENLTGGGSAAKVTVTLSDPIGIASIAGQPLDVTISSPGLFTVTNDNGPTFATGAAGSGLEGYLTMTIKVPEPAVAGTGTLTVTVPGTTISVDCAVSVVAGP